MTKSKKGEREGFVVQNRRKGFGMIGNDFIDLYGPIVGAYGIAAYCILVRFASAGGEDAKPSYNKVAALMNTSRPTAIKAIKQLVSLRLIAKEKRTIMGEPVTNVYSVLDVPDLTEQSGLQPDLQEVGSKPDLLPSQPDLLPSQPDLLPSQPRLPPSKPGLPDQYTIPIHHTNTPDQDTNPPPPLQDHHSGGGGGNGFHANGLANILHGQPPNSNGHSQPPTDTSAVPRSAISLAMRTLASEWAGDFAGGWASLESDLAGWDDGQVRVLLTWLYVWWYEAASQKHSDDPRDRLAWARHVERYYANVFAGVTNRVGLIISKVRAGIAVPLTAEDEVALDDLIYADAPVGAAIQERSFV